MNFVLGLLVRLPLWALLAAPILAALTWLARRLHRQAIRGKSTRWIFAALSAVLIAPMPAGMFLALVPNAYMVFGGSSYYSTIWPWPAASTIVTGLLMLLALWRYLAPSNNSFKGMPLRGTP